MFDRLGFRIWGERLGTLLDCVSVYVRSEHTTEYLNCSVCVISDILSQWEDSYLSG